MYNEELFQKLLEEFGPKAVKKYCLMTSRMYNFMYETCTQDVCNEYDYHRQWWIDKYNKLNGTIIIN
jgi:hypothetical protein